MSLPQTTWSIYILKDPRDGAVRYVGYSTQPEVRFRAHLCRAKKVGTYKYHWMKQLLDLGQQPVMEIVESGSGDWRVAEQRWIAYFLGLGCTLTNLTAGGDGTVGYRPTAETRAKMAAAHRGLRHTPESIAKTRAGCLGRKRSAECKAQMSVARKGKVPLPWVLAAKASNTGRKQTPEHVAKRIAPHIGRPKWKVRRLTAEQVRAIRADGGKTPASTLAETYGVEQTLIRLIRKGLAYTDVV